MTSRVVCRARAIGALTAVLRDDPDAPLPADADGWSAFLELAAELATARARFERSGVVHVFDAHMDAARRLFGAAVPPRSAVWRSGLHTRLAEAGVAAPPLAAGWTYAVRFPRSFTEARMAPSSAREAERRGCGRRAPDTQPGG